MGLILMPTRHWTSPNWVWSPIFGLHQHLQLKSFTKKKHSYKTQEIIAKFKTHEFLQRDLEERKNFKRRFGRKKILQEEVLEKKNFPPRGGLEERKICKSFLEGRILQEELWNKQFREKLQTILQEGALEEDSRILQKKK